MPRVLFLCTSNSCRSQMAEGFARARNDPDLALCSAGLSPTSVHPMAIRVMKEVGIDISGHSAKSLKDIESQEFDAVISLCKDATEACPILPGHPECVEWNLPDPAKTTGTEQQHLEEFRRSRDDIARLVKDFFERGYLKALTQAKRCSDTILNNISDGIIAHDLNRRIFFFNKAAESITGYNRNEVLNRDCHDVFPGNFCGAKCLFCDSDQIPPAFDIRNKEIDIVTKSGDPRTVEVSVKSLQGAEKCHSGVLVSFRDVTREHYLARRAGEIEHFSGIIGRDKKMLEVFELIRDLSETNAPVLIQGESGTGKELVAAAIHNEGPRAAKLFVPVNCGALPESLLETELFGHVKGAFTGAIRDKKGRFELADGGTIFLDEIGDIPPPVQVRLLRVLQEGTFERVGSEHSVHVDVRIVSATNKDLSEELAAGRFREDLYYRLNVVPIFIPPLRERRNDIPLLVNHILQKALADLGRKDITISHEALDIMMSYDWPGNVRELQNWIQFAMVKCREKVILPRHLPPMRASAVVPQPSSSDLAPPMYPRRRKLDIVAVREALREADGNRVGAAKRLGVSRATLYRFLNASGLSE